MKFSETRWGRGSTAAVAGAFLAGLVAVAQAEVAPPREDLDAIGTVRGDSLVVSRDRVIAAALLRNEMLAASGAMRDVADAEALGAWRGFLPQVQLGEFFLRSDDALMSFGSKLQNRAVTAADFDPTLLNAPGETNNFVTRIQAQQPVFNGGMAVYGKRAADAMSRAAGLKHRRAEETVRFQAVQACEGLALALAYEQVIGAAVTSAESHAHQAQSMFNNEMATEADLLQARVHLSGLQQRRIEVRHLVAVAGEYIKLMTAVDTSLPLTIDAPAENGVSGAVRIPATADQRSDIKAGFEEARAADNMVKVARGAMLPHVNLSVQRDRYSLTELFGNDASSWTLGVYATWDVFKGLGNISELRRARAQSRAAGHVADFRRRQAAVEAVEARLNVEAAEEKVAVAGEAVEAAREGLRIVTNQYREGLASMVDLLDIQAAATMAEGNLVQALHDYRVGLAGLLFAGGVAGGSE